MKGCVCGHGPEQHAENVDGALVCLAYVLVSSRRPRARSISQSSLAGLLATSVLCDCEAYTPALEAAA